MSTYGYVDERPLSFIDPYGLMGFFCMKKGTHVGIALPIHFVGGTQATRDKMAKAIEQSWSGSTSWHNVELVVLQVHSADPAAATVNVVPGNGTSSANGGRGTWYEQSAWGNWVYPHEAGHLLGLPDRSIDPGIMGRNLFGKKPTTLEIQELMENGYNTDCGCR